MSVSSKWSYSDYAAVRIDPNEQSAKNNFMILCCAYTSGNMLNQIAKYLGWIVAVSIVESQKIMYSLLTAEGRHFP